MNTGFNNPSRVAEGWYWALHAHELDPVRPSSITLMGRELVLMRNEDGGISAFDAHCPHMGCHLGLGRLRDGALECFFHGWQFDGQGNCVHVPHWAAGRSVRSD